MRKKLHRRTNERQGNPVLLVLFGFFAVTVLYCTVGTKYCTDHKSCRPAAHGTNFSPYAACPGIQEEVRPAKSLLPVHGIEGHQKLR
jgi:hypothetical protein